MKLSKLFNFLLFPFTLTAQVLSDIQTNATETCPNLDSINRINQNHYVSGKWDAIIQGTNHHVEIKHFMEVVYSAENQTNPWVSGRLLHCSYELNNQKKLDMKLQTDKNRARINNSTYWNNIAFFGEPSAQYYCDHSIEACQFNLT